MTVIYAKKIDEFIIYKQKNDLQASYKITAKTSPNYKYVVQKYAEYCNKVNTLKTFHGKVQNYNSLNQVFSSCMNNLEQDHKTIDSIFATLDSELIKSDDFVKITYATNSNYSVFLDKDGIIRTKYFIGDFNNAVSVELADCQYRAKKLESLANKHLKNTDLQLALDRIAIALCHALKLAFMKQQVSSDTIFHDVERSLHSQFTARLRLQFMSSVILFTLFFGASILYALNNSFKDSIYVLSMLFALLGSFVSIIQRHNSIEVTTNMHPVTVGLESFSRLSISLVFGVICVLLAKSELALATFNTNNHALLIFSFLSGFSERFMPNMLNHIHKEQRARKAHD